MYPRTNYEMTEADLEAILDACKPVPMIMLGCCTPRSQQENANDAWAALGKRMGFDHMTVQPIDGKGMRFFTAVPSENEVDRAARLSREARAARDNEIAKIEQTIAGLKEQLASLQNTVI